MDIHNHPEEQELHGRASSPRGLAGDPCSRLYPRVVREVVPCRVHHVHIRRVGGILHVRGDQIPGVLRPAESPCSHPSTEDVIGDRKVGAWVQIRMDLQIRTGPTEAGC